MPVQSIVELYNNLIHKLYAIILKIIGRSGQFRQHGGYILRYIPEDTRIM